MIYIGQCTTHATTTPSVSLVLYSPTINFTGSIDPARQHSELLVMAMVFEDTKDILFVEFIECNITITYEVYCGLFVVSV